MGQPITVTVREGSRAEVRFFEANRSITGMAIELYASVDTATGDRPPDVLAKRLFDLGATKANVQVAGFLFNSARNGNVSAQIFWLKTRARWKDAFDKHYKEVYGIDATGYAGQGYACAQIVLDAINRAGATNPADMAALREAVRAAATDTSQTYNLDVGPVTLDANGDTSQKIVSIYSYDPTGASGKGDWKFSTQIDANAK
jgi:hypothetical protein